MILPASLMNAIQAEAARVDRSALMRAVTELTSTYKAANYSNAPLRSEIHRLAYTVVRLPATYAANLHVFKELQRRIPSFAPESVLDLGAGPGTALWAAVEVFPSVKKMTAVERDSSIVATGKRFFDLSDHQVLRTANWQMNDVSVGTPGDPFDLIIASYSLGELSHARALKLVRENWAKCSQALVIIEPGTRRGFNLIHAIRSELIQNSASIAAPCPHRDVCPMAAVDEWCHFSQRLERTSLHRQLKDGSMGYEDEKFSYVAASKLTEDLPRARIVRHPMKFSGYVKLQLCSGPALEQQTVTRSQKEFYKLARHADWGDAWNF